MIKTLVPVKTRIVDKNLAMTAVLLTKKFSWWYIFLPWKRRIIRIGAMFYHPIRGGEYWRDSITRVKVIDGSLVHYYDCEFIDVHDLIECIIDECYPNIHLDLESLSDEKMT